MKESITPYEEIKLAIQSLLDNKVTLDNTDVEYFDKDDIRSFIVMCNEAKLSAVKVLKVLEDIAK